MTLAERASKVRLIVFDVDGVLTDGGLIYGPGGEEHKKFYVKDGHGMVMARLVGVHCAILTARSSDIVTKRGEELRLSAIFQGKKFKGPALLELCKQLLCEPHECAYMGDDTNDLPAMALAGLAAAPADACPEALAAAHFVSKRGGGQGAARELIEVVLKARGLWEKALEQMSPK